MDTIDYEILELLSKNSRVTATEMSKVVNLSIPAVSERIRNLEEMNIIEGYTVKINRKLMGYHLLAFIFVDIALVEETDKFKEEISSFKEVLECHHIAGEHDLLIKVLVEDTDALENFISRKLKKVKGVYHSKTSIVLSTLEERINREK